MLRCHSLVDFFAYLGYGRGVGEEYFDALVGCGGVVVAKGVDDFLCFFGWMAVIIMDRNKISIFSNYVSHQTDIAIAQQH